VKQNHSRFITSTCSWLTLSLTLVVSSLQAQQTEPMEAEFEMPVPIRSVQQIPFKTSAFTFVRVQYSSGPSGRGNRGAWLTDWPEADRVFSSQVERLTGLATNPDGLQLSLTDPVLQQYPFIYIVEAGQMALSDEETMSLRDYLLGGGFLMVDDFWGDYEWEIFITQFRRAFPDRELVELSAEHDIFRSFYEISELPQAPGRGGARSGEPRLWGLSDDDGRLMAIVCHNYDFGDAWEHLDDPWYPRAISMGQAIPMGVNIVVYALSH
jgi:hypothetical protein